MRGGWYSFESRYIKNIPIPYTSRQTKNDISEIVQKILNIKKHNPDAPIKELEHELNQLVYDLYELTDEEIKIVEESVG